MAVILEIMNSTTELLNIKRFFHRIPIYHLTVNIVERLTVSFIEESLDNRICKINP